MRFVDFIETKKRGAELSADQLRAAVTAYVRGEVPDYQMSAWLMAVRWRGLSDLETAALLEAMVDSGERWAFDEFGPAVVDKHSTGGVGDKVSLVLAPLAAACGCIVPMVSGRGLGHSGGTLDKLEAIPGLRTDLDRTTFARQLRRIGVAMGAQTDALVPADRLLYALRDVTATVDEPGLMIASILSKKIAEGARGLVLDVKAGSGAFLRDREQATTLARRLCDVGTSAGLHCCAWITGMSAPLGRAVGNSLEVAEAIDCLRGEGPADLRTLVLTLVAEMLVLGELAADTDEAISRARSALDGGAALERFVDLVRAQGGDAGVAEDSGRLPRAPHRHDLRTATGGWVTAIDARAIGEAAVALGAGRAKKDSRVDPGAGVVLHTAVGDAIDAGTAWATLHYSDEAAVPRAGALADAALLITDHQPPPPALLLERRA